MRRHTTNTTTWREWSDALRGLTIDEISDKNTLYNAIATMHLRQNELDIQMANMSIQGPNTPMVQRLPTMMGRGRYRPPIPPQY